MSQAEIFGLVQQVQDQYAQLFAEIVTINSAMIVAIFYFLHRATLGFRVAAFAFYLIGMLTLTGMMLHEANVKGLALAAMAAIAPADRAPMIAGYLALQDTWLFRAISLFQNLSLWALVLVIAYMLFGWRNPEADKPAE